MKYLYTYMIIFMFFCLIGWILEVLYRSYKHKHFVNPGFLVGCALPIYGTGGLALYLICSLKLSFITSNVLRVVVILVICTILMTLIEFVAGYISLKYYHNRLWDYSDVPGNIMGIICPIFSLAWGVCGAIFYFGFMPWLPTFCKFVYSHDYMIMLLGMAYGVFFVDLCYSLKIMDKIRHYAKHINSTIDFEGFKRNIKNKLAESKNKIKGLSIIKLRNYMASIIDTEILSKKKDEESRKDSPNK